VKECSGTAIARYQKKISGPLLDRIDIHVEVPRIDKEELADKRNVEDSKTIRARMQAARERQLERFKGMKLTCNAEIGPTEVREFCQTDASGEMLLKAAVQQLHLSARTIAGLTPIFCTSLHEPTSVWKRHTQSSQAYHPDCLYETNRSEI
jgi:magnesium chelatase family protein